MKNKFYLILSFLFLIIIVVIVFKLYLTESCDKNSCAENELCNYDGKNFACLELILCPEIRNEFCITLYEPVCGNNYKTYSNSCVACSNKSVRGYVKGECKVI